MSDYMCPNCVTPLKCNGPHIPEAVSDRPIHEVLAEISAKVPPEEWAKLDKTHYADPDTLATLNRLERENAALRHDIERHVKIASDLATELEQVRKAAEAMKAATYSHIDGRDLLHELQPNGAHHIDILVRINGQDRRYQGDWLKTLTWARDGHNMGEYADNPQLRALIEQRLKYGPHEVGVCSGSLSAAIAQGKGEK